MKRNGNTTGPLDPRTRPRCKLVQKPHKVPWHVSSHDRSHQSQPPRRHPRSSRALRHFHARA